MYRLIHSVYLLLAVISRASAHDLPPAPPLPQIVQEYKTFHALDCFNDDILHRSLVRFVDMSVNLTVETCLDICLAGGFTLGGVEFGQECYCGNSILYNPEPDVNATSGCGMPCAGAPEEACGGPFKIEIYQNGNTTFTIGDAHLITSYKNWTASGCFEDTAARLVPNRLPLSVESMTVENCLDGCDLATFNVAALQFGQECYCGNVTLPVGEAVIDAQCNMPCTGNATELCGAGNLNWVYFQPDATFSDA